MRDESKNIITDEQKHRQMIKEAVATFILLTIVAVWHVGFAFLLNGTDVMIIGMPLWFFVSTIGGFVISVAGVVILLKFVFKDFELGEEMPDEDEGSKDGGKDE